MSDSDSNIDEQDNDHDEEESEEEDVYTQMRNDCITNNKDAESINKDLAYIVENKFDFPQPSESLIKTMGKFSIPENCQSVKPPTLDKELVDKGLLSKAAQQTDNRLCYVQNILAHTTVAVISASEKIHDQVLTDIKKGQIDTKKISKQLKSVMEINTEAVTLLGHASQELSVRRRFQMQKHLPNDIASLSQIQVEPRSDTLFGFDIEKKMKDARESYRAKSYKFNRFKPYSSSYRGKNSKSFLGKDTFPQRGRYNSRRGSARRGYYPQRGFRK